MKYFILDGAIGSQVKEKFVDFVNAYQGEHIHITINSRGGSLRDMSTMVGMINAEPGRFTVKLIAGMSAAFEMFRIVKCQKELWYRAIGMYHFGYESTEFDYNAQPVWTEDIFKWKMYKRDWAPEELKVAKTFMTDKEYKKFKKGKDVYFDTRRMKEIFPEATIVN